MSKHPARILLIGPLLDAAGNNVGGATRSFGQLLQYFEAQQVPHRVINTQHFSNGLLQLLHVKLAVLRHIWQHDILFLNTSQNGIRTLGPLLYLFARLLGRKLVIRPFGGALAAQYKQTNGLQRWLLRHSVLKADILYLQTQLLMDFFAPLAKNITQLPTTRFSHKSLNQQSKTFQKRFLFVGQINKTKGVEVLQQASELLDNSYIIHFYGPLKDSNLQAFGSNSNYKGALNSEAQLMQTLANYDVLVLPTHYSGEGYPGVIVEAYSIGMPVVATDWMAIPEMVTDGNSGFLVPPKSPEALAAAMQRFTAENYPVMRSNARALFEERFEANAVLKRLLNELNALI